jgi:hypothetical protein
VACFVATVYIVQYVFFAIIKAQFRVFWNRSIWLEVNSVIANFAIATVAAFHSMIQHCGPRSVDRGIAIPAHSVPANVIKCIWRGTAMITPVQFTVAEAFTEIRQSSERRIGIYQLSAILTKMHCDSKK